MLTDVRGRQAWGIWGAGVGSRYRRKPGKAIAQATTPATHSRPPETTEKRGPPKAAGSRSQHGRGPELELLVRAGLSPLEALQSATRDTARYLGHLDQGGTVEAGKAADLVLLDADPLADIRNSRRITAVVQGGKWLARDDLDRLLAGAATAAAADAPKP